MLPTRSTLKTSTLLVLTGSLLAGCATPPGGGNNLPFSNPFVSSDPCASTSRNIGIAVGTFGGAVLGHYTGNKKNGTLIGGVLGGTLGGLIGYSMDKKRCELAKLAQKHQLEMTVSTINSSGELVDAGRSSKIDDTTLGVTVSITDKDNKGGHFQSGSDKLTSQAEQYFAELARIYSPERVGEGEPDANKRAELKKLASERKLLLIGHTDDTGSTTLNADLSERRARSVARFLSRHGIPEDMLYYQGAGETLPIADNRLESGRAQNRRVELVELGDETRFRTYLETRTPRYEFYRSDSNEPARPMQAASGINGNKPTDSKKSGIPPVLTSPSGELRSREKSSTTPNVAVPASVAATQVTPSAASKKNKLTRQTNQIPLQGGSPQVTPALEVKSGLDFGGSPVNSKSVALDFGRMTTEHSESFISKAWADDVPLAGNCSSDRPRSSGQVKALVTGKSYTTSDYMPGLYNTSWVDKVNGHLVALNKLAVLRQDAQVARLPELLVYPNYQNDANAKAAVKLTPQVNTYRGSKGLLYRIFVNHSSGLQCIDLVLPYSPPFAARGGYVYQKKPNGLYRTPYAPKIVGS